MDSSNFDAISTFFNNFLLLFKKTIHKFKKLPK